MSSRPAPENRNASERRDELTLRARVARVMEREEGIFAAIGLADGGDVEGATALVERQATPRRPDRN